MNGLGDWVERETGKDMGSREPVVDEAPTRVSKQGVVYLHVLPDEDGQQTQYQCVDCPMWISDALRCVIHGPEDVVEGHGTCGYFVKGSPVTSDVAEPHGNVTPIQSGYAESLVGFSCKRCAAFVPQYDDGGNLVEQSGCDVVDYDTPGDDPGFIHPDACCAAWQPSPQVADQPTEEFPPVVADV